MGFMAGFGSAFADSFNQQQKISGDLKSDKIRLDYQDALSRRKTIDEQDKKNKEAWGLAKQIARVTDQPDEAIPVAFEMLKNGADQSEVWKHFQNNKAVVKNAGASDGSTPADPRDDLTSGAQSAVDSNMAASGMKQAAPGGGLFGKTPQAIEDPNNPNLSPSPDVQRPSVDVGNTASSAGAPVGTGRAGEIRKGKDGKNYQYAETTGMAGANGSGSGWIETNQTAQTPVEGEPVVGNSDVQISWEPKAKAADFSKINSVPEAQNALDDAIRSGNEADIKDAKTRLNNQMEKKAWEARQVGIANGTYSEPNSGVVHGPDNSWTTVTKDTVNGQDVWTDGSGKQVDPAQVSIDGPDVTRDIDEMAKQLDKPLQDYNANVATYKDTLKSGSDMVRLVTKYPKAVDLSGRAIETIDRYMTAGANIKDLILPKIVTDPNGNQTVAVTDAAIAGVNQAEAELETALKRPLDALHQNAIAAALIDVKATKLAYAMAKQVSGQTGRSIAVQEFQAFKNNIMGNGKPSVIAATVKGMVADQKSALKASQGDINTNSVWQKKFALQHKGRPSPFQPAEDIDSIVGKDGDLKTRQDEFEGAADPLAKNGSNPIPPEVQKVEPKVDQATWDELPESARALLRKKAGIK